MAEASISDRVLDTLVTAGLITVDQLASVSEAAGQNGGIGKALIDRGLVTPADVATVLEDELGIPRVDLSSYAPDDSALELVPASMARARRILPLFEIEGMLTVAIGDPMDVFTLDSLAAALGVDVEAVLAESSSVLGAIVQYYGERETAEAETPAPAAQPEPVAPAPEPAEEVHAVPLAPAEVPLAEEPHEVAPAEPAETIEQVVETAAPSGPPAVDLDVLAVADARKTAILVADILEDAARRGATRIHVLPYKDDFFLVYRVKGRLEKVASAPLSMVGPLVEAFKNVARLANVPAGQPALGRVRTRLAEREVVLTVSSVPTVSGARLVASIAPLPPEPRPLPELGMPDAETRALHAMVERGRGLLLVCAPVAAGRSATYYALLAHAAHAGKTVYSVERSVEYEIPAVAQVLVNPGSSVAPASYFAAGMRQDTDVVAIDGLQSVEDVHLAVEAAGLGKLVIATFAAGDVVSGVRRMLDLGVEPNSLAAALTLGVGQRLVRTNCPACSVEQRSDLAAKIPGATPQMTVKAGAGCDACGKSGFAGVTGIFEVLPFTEPVRAAVARDVSADALADAARAAGMRSLLTAGLSKVSTGLVSPQELDRVMRFS